MKAYKVATVLANGTITPREGSLSKKQALYRARVLKNDGHVAVIYPADWSDEKLRAKIYAKARKNPSEKGAPKSRAARMRKLRAVVAKAGAGSAYNKAKRKPRKLQYIARGTSKAVANAFDKTAKRLKLNPDALYEVNLQYRKRGQVTPQYATVQARGHDAQTAGVAAAHKYADENKLLRSRVHAIRARLVLNNPSVREIAQAENLFRDFSGHEPTRQTKVRVEPMRTALEVGSLAGVMYEATRDGEKELYLHRFKKSSRPLLIANHDGSQLGIVGGRFQFTDRGIVDK
jgi:hypothetical protein